ncbi:MAG: DUF6531 domain-containing protein, partial [Pirellulaceae bacterium]|nr:DUF6531 domain-containing protein [Pirellulaceae bacterium]
MCLPIPVPKGGATTPARTAYPVYLREGAVLEEAVDLQLPGPAPGWRAVRTYSSRVTGSAALGGKWLSDLAEYRLVAGGTNQTALIVDATGKRVFTSSSVPPPPDAFNTRSPAFPPGALVGATAAGRHGTQPAGARDWQRHALGSSWLTAALLGSLGGEGILPQLAAQAATGLCWWDMQAMTAPEDSLLVLAQDTTNAQFVLTDWHSGEVHIFHDLASDHPGRLKESTTLAWRASGQDGTLYTYNASHQVTQITTAEGQDYNVVCAYTNNRLTKIEVRTGADTSTRIRQAEYLYFDSQTHSADVGADGDLVQVTLSALRSGGSPDTAADWIVRVYQYRYDSQGLLKGVFEPDAVARLIADRADVDDPAEMLAKGDDDNNNGSAAYRIRDYAQRWFTYYTVNVKTDNSGAGTSQDPKCVTVWAPSGENLQSKYGGSDVPEVDSGAGKYLVRSETIGGCASCGSGTGTVQHEYFYLQLDHGTPDPNEVVWLVVEDVSDGQGTGIRRTVHGLNDAGRLLRHVTITDPVGTPQFWCHSWKLESAGQKLHRLAEDRSPAAHNVTSSTVDEFLNPSHNGDYTNDNATLQTSAGPIHVYYYNTAGDQTDELLKRGRTGTLTYLLATDYYGGTNANRQHLVTARYQYPQAETSRTAASRIATSYAYTFWDNSDTVKKRTATLPTVPSGENGSGAATTTEEYYDTRGRLRWQKDAAGYVTYHADHPEHGQLAYSVADADPSSLPSSADNQSTKWVTSSDGSASSNKPTRGAGLPTAVALVHYQEYDAQGRVVLHAAEQGGTVLSRHYTVYDTYRHLQFPHWDTTTHRPLVPIEVSVFDDGGQVTDQVAVDPARTAHSG